MNVLDIGGGFPLDQNTFCEIAIDVNAGIDKHFGDLLPEIKLIAEPGMFMVKSSQWLIATVIAEKLAKRTYILNAGKYQGFLMSYLGDHIFRDVNPYVIYATKDSTIPGTEDNCQVTTLWGPTCDPGDKLICTYLLPRLRCGDWVVFPNTGAYTYPATRFNGFTSPKVIFVSSSSSSPSSSSSSTSSTSVHELLVAYNGSVCK